MECLHLLINSDFFLTLKYHLVYVNTRHRFAVGRYFSFKTKKTKKNTRLYCNLSGGKKSCFLIFVLHWRNKKCFHFLISLEERKRFYLFFYSAGTGEIAFILIFPWRNRFFFHFAGSFFFYFVISLEVEMLFSFLFNEKQQKLD